MPRAQVYIDKNNYERVRQIVDEKRNDGADASQANISSVCGMLLDLGLRVYSAQKKREAEGEENRTDSDGGQADFNRVLMNYMLKTSYASTMLLRMVGEIDEVKSRGEYQFESIRAEIRRNSAEQLNRIFDAES